MTELVFNSAKLKQVFQQLSVLPCKLGSIGGSRPEITGVHLQINENDNEVCLAATDGYMLGATNLTINNKSDTKLDVILPLKFIKDTIKVIKKKEPEITLIFGSGYVSNDTDEYKLIEGNYPSYGIEKLSPNPINDIWEIHINPHQVRSISKYIKKLKVKEQRITQALFHFEGTILTLSFYKKSPKGFIKEKEFEFEYNEKVLDINTIYDEKSSDYVIECTLLTKLLKYLPQSHFLHIVCQPEKLYVPYKIKTNTFDYVLMPIHSAHLLQHLLQLEFDKLEENKNCGCQDKNYCDDLICIEDYAGNNTTEGYSADWCPHTKFVYFGGAWFDVPSYKSEDIPSNTDVHEYVNSTKVT